MGESYRNTEALLATVRKACPARTWSQGVKLARDDASSLETSNDDELVLRVKAPGRAVALTVVLYPNDSEWDCNCGSREPACAHVAAAMISLNKADKQGEVMSDSKKVGQHVSYRLVVEAGSLSLTRYLGDEPLEGTLSSHMSEGAQISAEQHDLVIDQLLTQRRQGPIPPERVWRYLGVLSESERVTFDGEPVRTSGEKISPIAIVDDVADGVRLRIEANPKVTGVVAIGVGVCGNTLHPLAHTRISGPRLDWLPIHEIYEPSNIAQLMTKRLPHLPAEIEVDLRSSQLPGVSRSAKPRLSMDVSQDGATLSVLPLLVYGDPVQARIDGNEMVHLSGDVPVRDRGAEKRLIHALLDELNLVPGRKVEYFGRDAITFATRLRQWKGEIPDDSRANLFDAPPLEARIEIDGDALDVVFETRMRSGDDDDAPPTLRRADPFEVMRAWRSKLGLVPLLDGGWAPLPTAWLDEYGNRVADLLAARDEANKVSTAVLPDLAALCDDLDHPRPPSFAALEPLIDGFESLPAVTIPTDVTAELRHYQEEGVAWLSFLRDAGLGGVLADDMGLGKTLQALCALTGRTLVVCPRSVVHNWEAEIAKFRPSLSVSVFHGPKRELDPDVDVTLTTYSLLRIDRELLREQDWETIILDEAQAIKNPDSQVARAAFAMEGGFRMTLSGTPVENRLEELWSQMHFVNRGLLAGRSEFQRRYSAPIGRGEPGAAESLRSRIRPFVLRRLKRDVAPELPPRTEMVMYCELDEGERLLYDTIRAATRKDIVERLAGGGSVIAALEALLRLRQASCHAGLVPGSEAERSSKVDRLCLALEDAVADGHKSLVFSQWTSLLDRIEPHLESRGIDFVRLDGSTRNRGQVVESFQNDDGPPVMLISLKAGGTGLNLTAADHVFLCDPWWNPAVEDQAADRTHRIGQDKPVMVYRLVATNTVEERILELQDRKRGLADAALGGAERAASLTRDDLLTLLQ